MYRPPVNKNFSECLSIVESILDLEFMRSKQLILGGDFNVNLLNYANDNKSKNLADLFFSNSMYPLITKPTRFPNSLNNSSLPTLLDHIWTNIPSVHQSGIFWVDITDHLPTFSIFNVSSPELESKIIKFRDYSIMNKQAFIANMYSVDWAVIVGDASVSECTAKFVKKFYEIYNESFPVRCKQLTDKRKHSPWLSSWLIKSIDLKHKLSKLVKQSKFCPLQFKRYKNILTSKIRLSKRKYFKEKFTSCMNDMKTTWNNINGLLSSNKNNHKVINISENDEILSDPSIVANKFNNYFVDVSNKLSQTIAQGNCSYEQFLKEPLPKTFFMNETDPDEIKVVINSLKNKSCGLNQIPTRLIKIVSDVVSFPICTLFNRSIEEGIFPSCIKEARVTPVFKNNGDPQLMNNYRPISVLPFLSKVFERLVHGRMMRFLDQNNILYDGQFGFRPGMGTSDALLKFIDKAYNSLDDKNFF